MFETLDLQTIFRIKRYAQVQDAGKIVRAFTVYLDKKFHTPPIVIAIKMKAKIKFTRPRLCYFALYTNITLTKVFFEGILPQTIPGPVCKWN